MSLDLLVFERECVEYLGPNKRQCGGVNSSILAITVTTDNICDTRARNWSVCERLTELLFDVHFILSGLSKVIALPW